MDDNIISSFGSKIKKIREELGYSQIQFAQRLEITQSKLSKMERNTAKRSVIEDFIIINKICDLSGITIYDFFGFKEKECIVIPPEMEQLIIKAKQLTKEQIAAIINLIDTIS